MEGGSTPMEEGAAPDSKPVVYRMPCAAEHDLDELTVYETKHRIFIIAKSSSGLSDRRRMMYVERQSKGNSVVFRDNPVELSAQECEYELQGIDRSSAVQGGLKKLFSAYGVLGFVRFLDQFYIALIMRRRLVGCIAGHNIYCVAAVKYFPLGSQAGMSVEAKRAEERYIKYLLDNDVMRDCFYSHSYALTRTLQTNMGGCPLASGGASEDSHYMFTWNRRLLEGGGFLSSLKDKRWATHVVHGYFEQRSIAVLSGRLILTLVARRSWIYAGTRYLRRGVTFDGHCANEVETEQILSGDGLGDHVLHTSYVQLRGSVPLFWSQVTDVMVPKPDIVLYTFDPLYEATKAHMSHLVRRYAEPIFVLDLVKQNEKRPRESKLGRGLLAAINHINDELDNRGTETQTTTTSSLSAGGGGGTSGGGGGRGGDGGGGGGGGGEAAQQVGGGGRIRYLPFDFSRAQKLKLPVVEILAARAADILAGTGFFCSQSPLPHSSGQGGVSGIGGWQHESGFEQRGAARTNCVDCLDRTNVGQLIIARVALEAQLQAHSVPLGQLDDAADSAMSAMGALTQMYADLGDRVAQQYAGTDAHSKGGEMVGARLKDKLKSMLVTVSRYYQNSFTDGDKQKAYDLFHGVFEVTADGPQLWEIDVEDSTSRRGGGIPPPFVPEGMSGKSRPWYEESIASFYDASGGKDVQLARLMPTSKSGSNQDGTRFEARHETSLITSFDEVLSRSHVEPVANTPGRPSLIPGFDFSDRFPSFENIPRPIFEKRPSLPVSLKGQPSGKNRIQTLLSPVLASILPGGLVDEDEGFKEGDKGENEGEGGQRRRQVGFMGDMFECASLSTYTSYATHQSSVLSSLDTPCPPREDDPGPETREAAVSKAKEDAAALHAALGPGDGVQLLYQSYCSQALSNCEGPGDADDCLYVFSKAHQPEKHVFRKCTATERLIGGRLDWSHDPVPAEPPEEEFVHVDLVSELPELDRYVPSSSYAFAGSFTQGRTARGV